MNALQLGWVGLGNMGNPMVLNLLKAGFEVTVFNRTKDKEGPLLTAGATAATSLHQLIETADVVVTMLSNDTAVKEVFEGPTGLLAAAIPGKIIINMSTVAPETSRYLHTLCQLHQVHFIDAPVSGSVKPAQDGTLVILVGASSEDYETAQPLFDALGKIAIHVGAPGVASSAKLAINYLLGLNLQGIAETVLFAEKNGVSKQDMLNIINQGACGNGISNIKTPAILNDSFPAAFALKHLVKDLRLAKEAGLDSPLIHPLYDSYAAAEQEGLGDQDVMAIISSLQLK
ncbi:3-hydroxyisobutyrate dehydrogenase [Flavobacterium fryxellicola]|uniref:6-phosphogluconate dehydrogenase n=1 Tax=Flavobacterium fryxellicola TaxID=249352 RepID=A0A167UZ70_9FLAO|nr:NAD(P)-dependent oxidoreductase [Flavobacterium fryxellicola]OAB25938.1 6-phosphogluconate dehydrogenase [Flavobacterium fryxellicola]SHN68956.1 3-hydroxyisobutyrate dehydrogenase [Flavobacterium fryxellicola]